MLKAIRRTGIFLAGLALLVFFLGFLAGLFLAGARLGVEVFQ